tara:strand:+ start:901 stop:1809 length:909 start_codon:yes stop_codon:yes gene_type:complete
MLKSSGIHHKLTVLKVINMSSQQFSTPPIADTITTKAPVKVVKEKVVKEKVVKEKVVKEKKEKVVKEKVVKAKAAAVVDEVICPEIEDVTNKEKKARAPSLPAKYNRFIQYTYYMLRAINNAELEKNGEVLFDEEKMFEACHVFGEVNTQQTFVNAFLENKGIAKEMRTHLVDKKKDEKAAAKQQVLNEKAAEKQRKLDEKAAAKKAVADAKTAKKGASKKKTKKEPVDLVTSLVTLANSTEDEATNAEAEAEEDDEDELDVKIITIEDKQYLIDESNNLYDNDTHAQIGTWDCVTKLITTV